MGIALVKDIYSLTESFPKEEQFGLTAQMRRAAVSIPSNIAEGFRRHHNNEFRQFLYVVLGSCAEVETQTIIAKGLGFIRQGTEEPLLEKLDHIGRMTTNLIKKL